MDIQLPELSLAAVELRPRVERGDGPAPEPLRGPISLGGPVVRALAPEQLGDDSELRAWVEADGEHRYDLVHLAGSFAPEEDEPLQRVWIAIELWGPTPEWQPRPIAWSMQPEQIEHETDNSAKLTLGAELKVVKLGYERGASHVSTDVSLQALYALQPNPTWILERTEGTPIRGTQRFALVVRTPRGTAGRGRVDVGAIVQRRRFGPLTHRVALEDTPEALTFGFGEPGAESGGADQ